MKRRKLRCISILLLIAITMGLIPSPFISKSYANSNTKTMTVTIGEGEIDQSNLSKIVNIPNLKSIVKISVDTGDITYNVDGDKITLYANNGSPSRQINNPTKYNKVVTDYSTSSSNTFSNTKSYNKDGYSGTLNKNGGSYVISGNYTPSQNKNVTDTRTTQGSDITPETISYNKDGFSGTLSKIKTDTSRVQTGGTPADSKYVTAQTSANYDDGVYSGALEKYVYSGSYTPSSSKTVTIKVGPQESTSFSSTKSYNSGGYSGILSKDGSYYRDGSRISSKTVTDSKTSTNNSFPSTLSYNNGGYSGTLSKDGGVTSSVLSGSPADSKTIRKVGCAVSTSTDEPAWKNYKGTNMNSQWDYASGDYSGILYKDDSSIYHNEKIVDGETLYRECAYYEGTVYKPDTRVYGYRQNYSGTVTKIISLYSQDYSGTVTRPASDTRVWRYRGTVTKPDTRTYRTDYTAYYEGVVTKPAVDTRVWQQDYKGTVYKAGTDNYYKYNVTIEYIDNSDPVLDIETSPFTLYINKDKIFTLSGTISDIDSNQTIIISATIDGITKTKSFSSPLSNQPWSLTWSGDELAEGSYKNIVVKATDNQGGFTSKIYSGILNVDKTPPVITISDYIKTPTNKDIVVTASTNEGTLNKTTHTFTENGSFTFVAIDEAGNRTEKTVTITNIDKVLPIITIEPYNINWTNKDITVNAKVDKGTLNKASHTFTDNSSFEFIATDVAGNIAKKTVTITNIDKTLPTKPVVNRIDNKLVLTKATDNESGIDKHIYSLDDGEWAIWTNDIDISTLPDGNHVIKVKAIDKATNETEISFSFLTEYEAIRNTNKAIDDLNSLDESIISQIQEAIDNIQDKKAKNQLQNKLDEKIKWLKEQEATKAVEKARNTLNEDDYNKAKDLVENLHEGNVKDKLIEELKRIKDFIDTIKEQERIKKEVDNLIDYTDLDELDESLDELQDRIDNLPDGDDKDKLQDELDKLRERLQKEADKRLKEATRAVELAEATKREPYIQRAKDKVAKLKDGPDKEALEDRIRAIEHVDAEAVLLEEATKAVELAEATRRNVHIQDAKEKVSKLKNSPDKTALENRIKAIEYVDQGSIDFKDAELAVKLAEATKREPYVDKAKAKVRLLTSGSEKEQLEQRLYEIEKILNQNNEAVLKNAERIVSLAEKLKRESNLSSARDAINRLKPSEEKTSFLIRLEKVAKDIEGKELTDDDIAIIKAIYYVELAETYNYEFMIRKAMEEVEKLPEGQHKQNLSNRLNNIAK